METTKETIMRTRLNSNIVNGVALPLPDVCVYRTDHASGMRYDVYRGTEWLGLVHYKEPVLVLLNATKKLAEGSLLQETVKRIIKYNGL